MNNHRTIQATPSRRSALCRATAIAGLAVLLAIGLSSCPGTGDTVASKYAGLLFMGDTTSGGIFAYDPKTQKASAESIVSTKLNATGEIAFHAGIGYALVGFGADAGLFSFDLSAAAPAVARIGSAGLCAQYICFLNDTLAFVSVADYGDPSSNGVYSFDPTAPGSGLSLIAATHSPTAYPQGLAAGADGLIYVANNDSLGDTASVSVMKGTVAHVCGA